MTTYPEMNEQIVDMLRFRGDSPSLYAAGRIEELEAETGRLREQAQRSEAETQEAAARVAETETANLRGALQATLTPLEAAADALVPPGARVEEAMVLVEEALVAIREELE